MKLSWESQLKRAPDRAAATRLLWRTHLSSLRRQVETKNFSLSIDAFLNGKNTSTFFSKPLLKYQAHIQ